MDNPVQSIEFKDDVLLMTLAGHLDYYCTPDVRSSLAGAVNGHAPNRIVVDLSAVKFMDSAAIALFVELHKQTVDRGSLHAIVTEQSQPDRILKVGRFDTIITIERLPAPPPADAPILEPEPAVS